MSRQDLIALIGNLSTACMVLAANMEETQGTLQAALMDSLATLEHAQDSLQTVLMVQDGDL